MTATRTQNTTGSRRWIFWIFLALAMFYLGVEHRVHLAGALRWLPLAILLLCPFMHMFMHKGHGGHSGHERGNADATPGGGHDGHDSRVKSALTEEESDTSSGGR